MPFSFLEVKRGCLLDGSHDFRTGLVLHSGDRFLSLDFTAV